MYINFGGVVMVATIFAAGMALGSYIMERRYRKKQTEQRTWVFCPECKTDMVSNNSCYDDSDLVRYECKVCGNKSEWNFDIAPVALLMRSDNGASDIRGPKANETTE